MRPVLLAFGLLGFASCAQAQEIVPPIYRALIVEPKLTLHVTTDQAMLLVQTLGAIGCQNVTQLMVCQQAAELLREIREQAKMQGK